MLHSRRRKILLLFSLLLLTFTSFGLLRALQSQSTDNRGSASGSEVIYFVSPNGTPNSLCSELTPCDSIENALKVSGLGSEPNHKIVVKDGVYQGTQKLMKKLFLHEVSVEAQNQYRAVLENDGTVIQMFNIRNLRFSGFELRHIDRISSCSTSDDSGYLLQIKDLSDPNGHFGSVKGAQNGYYDQQSRFYPNGTDYTGNIIVENNIFHDSFCEDLIKLQNGGDITIRNNVFYNQATRDNRNGGSNNGSTPEEAIDINSVFNVSVTGNIFFNAFSNPAETGAFIVVKDSSLGVPHGNSRFGLIDQGGNVVVPHPNSNVYIDNSAGNLPAARDRSCSPTDSRCDTNIGSNGIRIDRNIFLSFDNSVGDRYPFIQVGAEDTLAYVVNHMFVENNLFLGNGDGITRAIFELEGVNGFTFRNNTVSGNLPSRYFGYRLKTQDASWNYPNNQIKIVNNVWSDQTGTMGREGAGDARFSIADPEALGPQYLVSNNLYWNGGNTIPTLTNAQLQPNGDREALLEDPRLTLPGQLNAPVWNGSQFSSFNSTTNYSKITDLFKALVVSFASPASGNTPILDRSIEADSALVDIMGNDRGAKPDLGAYEINPEAGQPSGGNTNGNSLKINFQTESSTTPSGFIADTGERYALRAGKRYGWEKKSRVGVWQKRINPEMRIRNSSESMLRNTLAHLQLEGEYRWQIEVPNGRYNISLMAGDPLFTDQWNSIQVEDHIFEDDSYDNFDFYSAEIEVTDRKITLMAADSAVNAKVNYIIITPL